MFLTGYLDKLSARPGDSVAVHTSTNAESVSIGLVRLLHGDSNPEGPGYKETLVSGFAETQVAGRLQPIHLGSCMFVKDLFSSPPSSFVATTFVWPTLPGDGLIQGIVSLVDEVGESVAAVALDGEGNVHVRAADGETIARVEYPLTPRAWYRIELELSAGGVSLTVTDVQRAALAGTSRHSSATTKKSLFESARGLVAAALSCVREGDQHVVGQGFNGKLEAPTVHADGVVLAQWRFEHDMSTDRARDVSGNDRHGLLLNMPARAMTGHNWTGEELCAAHRPAEYGAIHFHTDDLVDAGWEVDAHVQIPKGIASGVYAITLTAGGATDRIPLTVLPAPTAEPSQVVFLLPTFTYVAYANERLMHRLDYKEAGLTDLPITPSPHDLLLAEHPEFGGSLYDVHTDGSGICYSSYLRPIPNMRPDYRMWLQNAPRHLSADLYVLNFLEESGISYSVITDHDLHQEGPDILSGYEVVITGSHPEYYSTPMLDALQSHLDDGGSLMYLGGNGFYWVTSQDPDRPNVLEVRRTAGIRTWEIQPGEQHHSTTAEPGGLWRWRGRGPNKLVGVGMCSQGWDSKAPPFERSLVSYEPQYEWIFDGVDGSLIGDTGLIMNGGSGDELDRCDYSLGSPLETVVLATSRRHTDFYQLAVEDVLMLGPGLGGAECEDVRSDMVLLEQPSGGAVFSVGSICFTGCLPVDNYENNAARLVSNVLANFMGRKTKSAASSDT